MAVSLRHPLTGEIRIQPEGWSWSCFLGAGFLGWPLFRLGLPVWGAAMLVLDIALVAFGWTPAGGTEALCYSLSLTVFAVSVFFGLRGNAMAIDRALALGWEYAEQRKNWFN